MRTGVTTSALGMSAGGCLSLAEHWCSGERHPRERPDATMVYDCRYCGSGGMKGLVSG